MVTLVHGDDRVRAAELADEHAGDQPDRVDAADTTAAELVTAASSVPMFTPAALIISNFDKVSADTAAEIVGAAARDVICVASRVPAKVLRVFSGADNTQVLRADTEKNPATTARRAAQHHGVRIDHTGQKTIVEVCGNDTAFINSIVAACALAGITTITARHVAALAGDSEAHAGLWELLDAICFTGPADALELLGRTNTDPHQMIAVLRSRLTDAVRGQGNRAAQRVAAAATAEQISQALAAIAAAERRLRSPGRPAAAAVAAADVSQILTAPEPV